MATESKTMYAFQKHLTAAVSIEWVDVRGCCSETKCLLFYLFGFLLTRLICRWRLRKAFYSKESQITRGWLERFQEVFCPLWTCPQKGSKQKSRQHTEQRADILGDHDSQANADPFIEGTGPTEKRALNLGDLRGMKPEYISNVTVHYWKENENSDRDSDLLTMSPTKIERLDRDSSSFEQFKGKLEPRYVELSDAMATSAAAISGYDPSLEMIRLHTILGWEMGITMISNFKAIKAESCFMKVSNLFSP